MTKTQTKHKKTMTGVVVSDKMVQSVVVKVTRVFAHPLYTKRLKKDKKYIADNRLGAKQGDQVVIEETRPLSRRKHWKVIKILKN
ncbi:MAG: 30S ribosomal protein S17 [bacterium]|nr:30S ribosomal protein S17 [bacterium]